MHLKRRFDSFYPVKTTIFAVRVHFKVHDSDENFFRTSDFELEILQLVRF